MVDELPGRTTRVEGDDDVRFLVPAPLVTYRLTRVDGLGLVRVVERWDEAVLVRDGVRLGADLLTVGWLVREVILVRDRVVGADRGAV